MLRRVEITTASLRPSGRWIVQKSRIGMKAALILALLTEDGLSRQARQPCGLWYFRGPPALSFRQQRLADLLHLLEGGRINFRKFEVESVERLDHRLRHDQPRERLVVGWHDVPWSMGPARCLNH